ncbi:Anaphase-promoting complex subunit 5 [Entomortierella beljakovae]|nr:Anaphase-promoting complex subunit 5 [Entomortierella beljakovae]
MGLYVRKARIEFKKMSFEDMCRLYSALETYISTIGKPSDHGTGSDLQKKSESETAVLSTFDVEKYLDHHTQQLTEMNQMDISEELLAHVRKIQFRMPTMAKAHYIACLHAQQTGDFEVAIQSLHRFFDYCITEDERELYQYALLNLAMLHARFSHFEQAVFALRETVEVARDHMDQECLSYALNWLHRLTGAASGTNSEVHEAQMLANLNEKDGKAFQYLRALSELTVAKQMYGESMTKTFSALVKASSINLKYSIDGSGGAIQLFQSRMWEAYGYAPLSSLYSQLQLKYRSSEADVNDSAAGYSKTASDLILDGRFHEALAVIEFAKTKFPPNTMKATLWIQTLVQILQRRAISTSQLRDAEILTQQLGVALVNTPILAAISEGGESKIGDGRGISRDNQLDDTSREIQLEIILQRALLSVLVGQSLSGAQQLSEGLAMVQHNQWPGTQKFTVMYLLALSEIYIESDSATSAMPLLLTAMTLCEHNLQQPLSLLVKLRLSEVLLYINSVQQANELVDSIMSTVLSQGDVYIHALAYFQRAKCLLAKLDKTDATQDTEDTRQQQQQQQLLQNVIVHLERALKDFQRIESLKEITQVLYFQVRVFHMLGQADNTETALNEFKIRSQALSSGRNSREPSWFTFYYARDSFEGILGIRDDKATNNDPNVGASAKSIGISKPDQSKRFPVAGPGGLKRTPSQLWQLRSGSGSTSILSPPDEHEEHSRSRSRDDSMDIDM